MSPDKRFLGVVGGCAATLALVYLVFVMPVDGEVSALRTDQETLKKRIESDLNSTEYHGDVDLKRLQQEVAALEDSLAGLKKTLDLRLDAGFVLEAGATDRLVKFKGALEETRRVLRKRAASADIAIPESFGFPEGEIADSDIPALLRRLDIMALLLGKALDAGVKGVTVIAPGGLEEADPKKNRLVTRDPVSVEFQGTFDATIRLIHALNLPSDFVGFDRVTLESASTEGDLLKVNAVVAGLELHPEVELEVKGTSGVKPGSSRTFVPGR